MSNSTVTSVYDDQIDMGKLLMKQVELKDNLRQIMNEFNIDTALQTPDYFLAQYLFDALASYGSLELLRRDHR